MESGIADRFLRCASEIPMGVLVISIVGAAVLIDIYI